MAGRDPRIDAYIAKAPPFAQPVLRFIRATVHKAVPEIVETTKWSAPHFDYNGMFCGMAAFKAHCAFGFWDASVLGERGTVDGSAGQFGRLTSVKDLPSEKALIALVKKAAALKDAGVKVKRVVRAPKAPLKAPAYMLAAIRKNKKAHAAYAAFSPSAQREYVEWITEAKSDETRARRLETAIEWIAEGKSRNWKYQR